MNDRSKMPHRTTLRMLDANLNRLTEGLRVVEDVCRFHWDATGFAAEFKALRHDVFTALTGAGMRAGEFARARDIEGDVGRDMGSPEPDELLPHVVALRNLQRSKEALRVLQECCRAVLPDAERALQEIRYRLYAEEKALTRLAHTDRHRESLSQTHLYLLVIPEMVSGSLEEVVDAALSGGVDIVQLRSKGGSDRETLRLARRLRELTARAGALFVVNDRVDLAYLSHADGVHLGQGDLSVAEARKIAPEEMAIGVSTHSVEQAEAAQRQGADYIGVGPVFPTSTKENHEAVLGPDRAAEIVSRISVPAFAIGGIEASSLEHLARSGCRRVAIASAILRASDPETTARAYRAALVES